MLTSGTKIAGTAFGPCGARCKAAKIRPPLRFVGSAAGTRNLGPDVEA